MDGAVNGWSSEWLEQLLGGAVNGWSSEWVEQ
jgi:hypothetical protein